MDNLNITVSIKHETISAKLFLENEMQTVHILAKIPANESFSVFFFQLISLIRIVVSYLKKVPKLVHTELTHILFTGFCLKPKFLISFDYYYICFKQEPTLFIGTKV